MAELSNTGPCILDKCGLALLSDLDDDYVNELFSYLEIEQQTFLDLQYKFRSTEYKWPLDPLHTWSRIWEYPYVYHHLTKWQQDISGAEKLIVADIGSGVTFFPFTLARQGFDITCVDIDPVCRNDLERAIQVVPCSPGDVTFRLSEGGRLPFKDNELDVAYSVSVIEHLPEVTGFVHELCRVLKSGGLLVATIDLDLRGDQSISVEDHCYLMEELDKRFEKVMPYRAVHPANILDSNKGPFARKQRVGAEQIWFALKNDIVKPLLRRLPNHPTPYYLAVEGMVLRKK